MSWGLVKRRHNLRFIDKDQRLGTVNIEKRD